MRTTVRLDDALLTAAKRHALETGRTLTSLIEEGLRRVLAERPSAQGRRRLPTYGSGGMLPGVDIDDSAALEDVMAGR